MIDWLRILAVGTATVGGALLLCVWSFRNWRAHVEDTPVGDQCARPSWRKTTGVGMGLICLGLAFGALPRWGAIFWVGVSLLWMWQGLRRTLS